MERGIMTQKVKIVLGSILVILAIIIVLQNTEVVAVNLLFWQITMSRSVALLVMFMLGILVGFGGTFLIRSGSK